MIKDGKGIMFAFATSLMSLFFMYEYHYRNETIIFNIATNIFCASMFFHLTKIHEYGLHKDEIIKKTFVVLEQTYLDMKKINEISLLIINKKNYKNSLKHFKILETYSKNIETNFNELIIELDNYNFKKINKKVIADLNELKEEVKIISNECFSSYYEYEMFSDLNKKEKQIFKKRIENINKNSKNVYKIVHKILFKLKKSHKFMFSRNIINYETINE